MRTNNRLIAVALCAAMLSGCAKKSPAQADIPPIQPASIPPVGQTTTVTGVAPIPTVGQAPAPSPASWPRTYVSKTGDVLTLYQPQIDAWKDHDKIRFRCAFAIMQATTKTTDYGVCAVQADTLVDNTARTVLMTNMDVAVRFPNMDPTKAEPLKAMVKDCLPNLNYLDISLDQVLAHMTDAPKVKTVDVSLAPPPMYYSEVPAIMVIYMGEPQFKEIGKTKLMFAVNTNWVVIMDAASGNYYLLDDESWLTATDPVKGPWTAATELPGSLQTLPDDDSWKETKAKIPGKPFKVVPKVFTSTTPAELIVTNGAPEYSPIPGTRLMYVSNPEMPLFWDLTDSNFYYLCAGRWFRAKEITGPWSEASTNLPAEFSKIPASSPMGSVLSSIPNTQEAKDAILLAQVPHKATINIQGTTVTPTYTGEPKFEVIQGTTMTYAVNTPYAVIFASGQYYCCYNGVWFVSPIATGPWAVCTVVPTVIYTIPPTCPIYNVTYCQVYGYTPTTVVVGYTSGYSGEYVAASGALMFGAGMMVGAAIASSSCYPCYYSYGCMPYYHYGYGCYYRTGAQYYGPHGGCGWGASYNPSTGTYSRSGYAYGPNGSVHGSQAYNPWSNTYAQHTGGSNGYKSWGNSYVQQGNKWAESSHQSNARGGVGYAQNSQGQWAEGAHSKVTDSSVARTSSGDTYASHDGNVYKSNGDGTWQKYNGNGNWSNTDFNKSTAQQSMSQAKSSWDNSSYKSNFDSNSSQWKSDWENKSGDSDRFTQSGLNNDSFSRSQGNANSGWGGGDHSGGGGWGGGGGDRFGGGDFGGGGGRFGGGGFGGGGGRFGGFRR